jgi:hypothetical protein
MNHILIINKLRKIIIFKEIKIIVVKYYNYTNLKLINIMKFYNKRKKNLLKDDKNH